MRTKDTILLGIVATSLLVSLTLSQLLPFWAVALLLLVLGLGFTYYYQLSSSRLEMIRKQALIHRAVRQLDTGLSAGELTEKIKVMASQVFAGCNIFAGPGEKGIIEKWQSLGEKILSADKTWIYGESDEGEGLAVPAENSALAGIPLQAKGYKLGVLYIEKSNPKSAFTKGERVLMESIRLQVAEFLNNKILLAEQEEFFWQLLISAIRAMEADMPGFEGHSERVCAIAQLLGSKLAPDKKEEIMLKASALLHDIGQGGAGDIDHPSRGAAFLPTNEYFSEIRQAILAHHERYDGNGYPRGLKWTEIPLAARIIAVADIYDALTRLSEEKMSHEEALFTIKKATGTRLDPLVVAVFEEMQGEIKPIVFNSDINNSN